MTIRTTRVIYFKEGDAQDFHRVKTTLCFTLRRRGTARVIYVKGGEECPRFALSYRKTWRSILWQRAKAWNRFWDLGGGGGGGGAVNIVEIWSKSKVYNLNVNAGMRTEIDLNESEIDLNECEHFLKANLDRVQSNYCFSFSIPT